MEEFTIDIRIFSFVLSASYVIFDSLSRIYGSEGNNFAKMFLGRAVPEINFSLSPPS